MQLEFPRLVYNKDGGYIAVNDDLELESALKAGWFFSMLEAKAEKPVVETPPEITPAVVSEVKADDDNSPPTREELKIKAAELGIIFDGRISDGKLSRIIERTLEK